MEKRQERPVEASVSATPSGEMTSVGFADAARRINRAAASVGLVTPAFRSPPRQAGLTRSISRRSDGSATVSVALRGRPLVAVVADMIDGVLAANPGGSGRSPAVRDRLWAAAAPCLSNPGGSAVTPRRPRSGRSGASPAVGTPGRRAA